jgi:hypothetical protein
MIRVRFVKAVEKSAAFSLAAKYYKEVLMKSFKELIQEELTDKQKQTVNRWKRELDNQYYADRHSHTDEHRMAVARGEASGPDPKFPNYDHQKAVQISQHVIPKGQDRVVIPLEHVGHNEEHSKGITVPDHIRHTLLIHGYDTQPHQYAKGLGEDTYGREVKLGKVFNKLLTKHKDQPLTHETISKASKDFNEHMNTIGPKNSDSHQVVISRHPYDVAGMSTGRGWTSCLHMDTGINSHYIEHEVREGSHVAYLTKKGDDEVKNPIARIALKPFTATRSLNPNGPLNQQQYDKHTILRPDRIYGTSHTAFEHTVKNWTEQHFPMKDEHDSYKLNRNVYNDTLATELPNYSKFEKNPNLVKDVHDHSKFAIMQHFSSANKPIFNKLADSHLKSTEHIKGLVRNSDIDSLIARDGTTKHRDQLLKVEPTSYVRESIYRHGNNEHKLHIATHETNPDVLEGMIPAPLHKGPEHTKWIQDNIHPVIADKLKTVKMDDEDKTHIGSELAKHGNKETHDKLLELDNRHINKRIAEYSTHTPTIDMLTNSSSTFVRDSALVNKHGSKEPKLKYLKYGNNTNNAYSAYIAALGLRHHDISEHVKNLNDDQLLHVASHSTNDNTLNTIMNKHNVPISHLNLMANAGGQVHIRKNAAHKFVNHKHEVVRDFARSKVKQNFIPQYHTDFNTKDEYLEHHIKNTPEAY